MKVKRLVLSVLAMFALVACGDDGEPTDTSISTTESSTQLANPASEYCIAQGGTIELVDEATGQVGYCNLPDGRRIEEWEYYNADNG